MKIIFYSLFAIVMLQSSQCQQQSTTTSDTTSETTDSAMEDEVETRTAMDAQTFVAQGNEPFWNVTIDPNEGILYNSMNEGKTQFPYVQPTKNGGSLVYKTETKDGQQLTVTLREATCMDSMSGKEFTHESKVEIGKNTLSGCAEVQQ